MLKQGLLAPGSGFRKLVTRTVIAFLLLSLVAAVLLSRMAGVEYASPSRTEDTTSLSPIRLNPGLSPLFVLSDGELNARPRAERKIALTFDDGPDVNWTPEILDVLDDHDAKATFYVTGRQVLTYPEIMRDIVRRGHEIGNHTFSHPAMGTQSAWRTSLQLKMTQTAVRAATGQVPQTWRPPYSVDPQAITAGEMEAARVAADSLGLVLALGDVSPRDYDRNITAERIVDQTLRTIDATGPDSGVIVVLHDAGGDRSRTIDAIDQLLTILDEREYKAVTISDYGSFTTPELGDRSYLDKATFLGFRTFLAAGRMADRSLIVVTTLLLIIGLIRAVAVILLAEVGIRRARKNPLTDGFDGPVTVILPAYNEETGILPAVESILSSDYGEIEIIVVDDGSSDKTSEIIRRFAHPNVRLLVQENAGKSTALNNGIVHASHEVVVLVDGDTIFEPGTIKALVAPLADPTVAAVGGNVKVGNRGGILGAWQHVEYVYALNIERRALDVLDCPPTIPGAIGAFRRDAVIAEGGVPLNTLAEDTDLTIALHRSGWHVAFAPDARAWTEVPTTVKALWSQRYRWTHGIFQALWKHRAALLERGHGGQFARRSFPYLLVISVTSALIAPAVDVFAIVGLLTGDWKQVLLVWGGLQIMAILVTAYAFRVEGESLKPLWTIPFQQFGHRQLMYGVILKSFGTAIAGTRLPWQKLERSGGVQIHPAKATSGEPVPLPDDARGPGTIDLDASLPSDSGRLVG